MTDFLSNLILRSAGEQPQLSVSILQPRLPSLFEPLGGVGGMPLPPPDPGIDESAAPTQERPASARAKSELPNPRPIPAFRQVENEPVLGPAEGLDVLTEEQSSRLPVKETPRQIIQPIQPGTPPSSMIQTPPFLAPRQETQEITMVHPEGSAVRKTLPANQDQSSETRKERAEIAPLKPLSVDTQKVDKVPVSPKQTKDPIQVTIRPLNVDFVLDDSAASMTELDSARAESKPAAVLQPISIPSHPMPIQQFEPAPMHSQRVVEIHIGRIEVRAAPSSGPPKRASQKTTMSLEEYLRSRPGEKQ